jgi:hypothetical protein
MLPKIAMSAPQWYLCSNQNPFHFPSHLGIGGGVRLHVFGYGEIWLPTNQIFCGGAEFFCLVSVVRGKKQNAQRRQMAIVLAK